MDRTGARKKQSTVSLPARLAVLGMAFLLLIPLVTGIGFTNHQARSEWEKRALAEWPEWTGVEDATDYFSRLSAYFDDHVGAALAINRIYRQILFYIFEDDPVSEITRGSDGFSYLNTHFAENPLSVFETTCVQGAQIDGLGQLEATIADVMAYYSQRGLRVSMAIAPSKPVLYPEHLPGRVPRRLREACLQYRELATLPRLLSESELASQYPIIYPFEAFRARRHTDAFYPPQSFHSTGESAHMLAALALESIGLPPGPAYSGGRSLVQGSSDLHMKGFRENITVWHYPYTEFGVQKLASRNAWESLYFPRPRDIARYRSSHPMAPGRKALLISNSFGAFIAPHLAPGFSETVNLNINRLHPRDYQSVLVDFVEQEGFTDVIFVLHDYSLIQGYKFEAMQRFFARRAR
jgi:hypothetical protein